MRIELGDHVHSQDGHDVGTIKHLILDPQRACVKTLVVEKGMLLPDDVEVPLSAVLESGTARSRLDIRRNRYTICRTLTSSSMRPRRLNASETFPNAPLGGLLWPGAAMGQAFAPTGYPFGAAWDCLDVVDEEMQTEQPSEVKEYLHQQDVENVIITEGDDVYSRDGEKVGEIHSVAVDTVSGKPTAFVVRQGHFFGADTTFLADTIASVDDGIVTLNMDKRALSPE